MCRATANRDLTELVKRGFLRKKGSARGTWYQFIFSGMRRSVRRYFPQNGRKPGVRAPHEKNREKQMSRKVSRKDQGSLG